MKKDYLMLNIRNILIRQKVIRTSLIMNILNLLRKSYRVAIFLKTLVFSMPKSLNGSTMNTKNSECKFP